MLRGSFYYGTLLKYGGQSDQFITLLTLSWIGWIWNIIHNLSITLLLIMPPLHILYNKYIILRYSRVKNSNQLTEQMVNFEMNLIQLKTSFSSIFKNKERLYRITSILMIKIIIETFEFTFALHLVEDYAINVNGLNMAASGYWNLFAISGVRYMSNFIHHVPIINLIPGQGVGITDLSLKISTQGIVSFSHRGELVEQNALNDIGEQSTLVMRMFNFYLKRFIALVISTVFISIAVVKKVKNG